MAASGTEGGVTGLRAPALLSTVPPSFRVGVCILFCSQNIPDALGHSQSQPCVRLPVNAGPPGAR